MESDILHSEGGGGEAIHKILTKEQEPPSLTYHDSQIAAQ